MNAIGALHVMGRLVRKGFVNSMMCGGQCNARTCGGRVAYKDASLRIILKFLNGRHAVFDSKDCTVNTNYAVVRVPVCDLVQTDPKVRPDHNFLGLLNN